MHRASVVIIINIVLSHFRGWDNFNLSILSSEVFHDCCKGNKDSTHPNSHAPRGSRLGYIEKHISVWISATSSVLTIWMCCQVFSSLLLASKHSAPTSLCTSISSRPRTDLGDTWLLPKYRTAKITRRTCSLFVPASCEHVTQTQANSDPSNCTLRLSEAAAPDPRCCYSWQNATRCNVTKSLSSFQRSRFCSYY